MASRSAAQIASVTAVAALTGVVGYAVYFDYMRRNDPSFRQSIKKQHKQIKLAAEQRSKAEKERNSRLLREALREVQDEVPPASPELQEAFFQEMVAEGEKLAALGPDQYVNSAKHFYRALRVYPQPVELLMIYQKVVPEPVFALLLELTSLTGAAPTPGGSIPGPPPAGASLSDLDDGAAGPSSPQGSGSGMGSGNEWERLSAGA